MFSPDFLYNQLSTYHPHQPEFHQAVREFIESITDLISDYPQYNNHNLLARLIEPERVIMFRVPRVDDGGQVQVNRGYRVQFNSAIGPYKGGLRFHPTVNLSILKFLGFEQIFKNSLTGLPMGGGKGGADFDPKGKSDSEIMRFCQSFMSELQRHIGANTDVPAGDIGVGGREIGYLSGMYKKLNNTWDGTMTGKGLSYGGSLIRPEATGYGLVYFIQEMLNRQGEGLNNKTVIVSGSGNVAQYAIEKCLHLGAKVISASDSDGTVWIKDGWNQESLGALKQWKNETRGRLSEFVTTYEGKRSMEFQNSMKPWSIPAHIGLPCATQNELDEKDAQQLIHNRVQLVAEGANMPTTLQATTLLQKHGILFAPGKASNAGGVATSGLEMSQNSLRINWTRDEVDHKLQTIMKSIHAQTITYGIGDNQTIDYVKGANRAGFIKVADAMLAQGIV
ncbi:MAG TPA: NADP-specific glutamate dehydrogenase [Candidatus Absconditabacterales bacterium]|nr:NADP-specific glutamate dehydrogenase [Candidatus Absconditabacterales bacterium]